MTKITGRYLIMAAGFILLIINLYNLDFNLLKNGPRWGAVSNLLLILAMIVSIRDLKKKETNDIRHKN